ncbi:MAG: YdcF family protein, partial [Coriobacteriia bacterium]|nr:YdcF family protein [Coriobacteriia bacterium]
RNAIYLLAGLLWAALMLGMRFGQLWMVIPLVLAALLFPLAASGLLVANCVTVVRRNGLSASSLLPGALAAFILLMYFALPVAVTLSAPVWVIEVIGLLMLEGLWFSFTLVALLLYSWFYRVLPRRRTYDYIVVHGAGLVGDKPSPLLAGRLDRALELWDRQGRVGYFIVSGGQGPDEEVSEARAMHAYLAKRGVPDEMILDEDESTTTMENLAFSKRIMDERAGLGAPAGDVPTPSRAGAPRRCRPYRCAVVTSDFHVFRCAEYAHKLGIQADGVGSPTRGWYWPAAFMREFIAITKAHLWPYVVIFVLWALYIAATYVF